MKKNINAIGTVLTEVKPHTIVSLIAMIISYVNMYFLYIGKPIINIGADKLNLFVGIAYTVLITLYGWYKNQSITEFARTADDVLYALRDGKLTINEVQKLLKEHAYKETLDNVNEDLFGSSDEGVGIVPEKVDKPDGE